MKRRVFLDTNIVIDYLAKRAPFAEEAKRIFLQSPRHTQLCISSLSFTTIFYVLKKFYDRKSLMEMLEGLYSLAEVLPTDEIAIKRSIHSNFTDFEDSVQYHTALSGNADYIVTRNPKDFARSELPVFTPPEFLQIPYWTENNGNTMLNEPEPSIE